MGASVTLWEATAPVKLPTRHCPEHRFRLESRPKKSGISPLPPPHPKARAPRLPPILRISGPDPMPSYSKAPRGLFVPSRVARIFTGTSISPSPSLRQRPSRYAIHAGQNLPDKGFRYLRTVIVTAVANRGLSSELRPCGLTPPVNLPALDRRQPLYLSLRFGRDLCFC